jgi:AcrR family transcriptional regulator
MHDTATPRTRRSPRLSAEERREAIVSAAMDEFAAHGLAGASVDAIAHRAGVSQPYVYQLFGTKKDLFLAVVGDFPGCDSPLTAMGMAYKDLLDDRTLLLVQLQAYAACSDGEVRGVVREEFGRLHRFVAVASGASVDDVHHFFAEGMLMNVGAAVQLPGEPLSWTLEQLGGAG